MNTQGGLLASLNVRDNEWRPVMLLMAVSLLTGLSNLYFITGVDALFLQHYPVTWLPGVFVASALVAVCIGYALARLQQRWTLSRLLTTALAGLLLSVVALWLALRLTSHPAVILLLAAWKEVMYMLLAFVFWALAGAVFDVRQGKRLFGLVATGEVGARIVGGFLVPAVVPLVGVSGLIGVAIAALLACLLAVFAITRSHGTRVDGPAAIPEPVAGADAWRTSDLWRNRYIGLFMATSVLATATFFAVEYAYLEQAQSTFTDPAQLASFLGVFTGCIGVATLLAGAFVSGPLLLRHGLSAGLVAMPLAILLCAAAGLAGAWWWAGGSALFAGLLAARMASSVFLKTVQYPAYRILYQPLPPALLGRLQAIRESIVEPLAVGIAGVALWLTAQALDASTVTVTALIIGLTAAWLVVAWRLRREYTQVLARALSRRHLRGSSLALNDGASLALLERGLDSPYEPDVIYALGALAASDHPDVATPLGRVFRHPSTSVRLHALSVAASARVHAVVPVLAAWLPEEPDPQVKAAVLRALCALEEIRAFDRVAPYLADPDPQVRHGAMVGLMRDGGIDGVLAAGRDLNHMLVDRDEGARERAARVLGEVGIVSYYHPLVMLLTDEAHAVRRAAVEAAGRLRNVQLLPPLIAHLDDHRLVEAAHNSLVAQGSAALPALTAALHAGGPPARQRRLLRIVGQIGGAAARHLLLARLQNNALRDTALQALAMQDFVAGDDAPAVIDGCRRIIGEAVWLLAALQVVPATPADARVHDALRQELDRRVRQAVLCGSFLAHGAPVRRALARLRGGATGDARANAIEALDTLLAAEVQPHILPLLEDTTPATRLSALSGSFVVPALDRTDVFTALLDGTANAGGWAQAVALQAIGEQRDAGFMPAVEACLSSPLAIVRETALWAAHRIDAARARTHADALANDPEAAVARLAAHLAGLRTETQGDPLPETGR